MQKYVIISIDKEYISRIKNIILKVDHNQKEIKVYQKISKELNQELLNYDCKKIYILGVKLNADISGIDIAQKIRNIGDWNSEIIFVTKHDNMFEVCHRQIYKVCTFIEKFNNFDKNLSDALKAIIKNDTSKDKFTYKDLNIYYSSILYIHREKSTRKLIIKTLNNSYEVNLTLKQIFKLLDNRFTLSHRSHIVNKEHIEYLNFKENYIVLDNQDKSCILSEKYKNNFKELV